VADVDLRKLRYFVAVAEERNFGRAAERLHVAQPVLSRQVRALESELGVALFLRSTRGTELTEAGAALLDDARRLLGASQAFRRRALIHGRSGATFTIGFMPGIIVTDVARGLAERVPDLRVEVLRTGWDDQVDVVHAGRADISIVRLPVARKGLRVVPLDREPRVVALPFDHPLAASVAVAVADLAHLELLQDADGVPEWRDAAEALRPNGLADRRDDLPHPTTVEEKLEYVASGVGIAIMPESAAQFYARPDIAYRRVVDVAPSEVALVYLADRGTPEIDAVVDLARAAFTERAARRDGRPPVVDPVSGATRAAVPQRAR
jgi:DNA-binding transcriptional LysR family regulator